MMMTMLFISASLDMKEMAVFPWQREKTYCDIVWHLGLSEIPTMCTDLQSGRGASDSPMLLVESVLAVPVMCVYVCSKILHSSLSVKFSVHTTFASLLYSVLIQRRRWSRKCIFFNSKIYLTTPYLLFTFPLCSKKNCGRPTDKYSDM